MRGFRPPQELDDKINALAESKKATYTDTLIELLTAATRGEDPNRYAWLDTACDALVNVDHGGQFFCFARAPVAHKLGDGSNEQAKEFCAKCKKSGIQKRLLPKEQAAPEPESYYHSCAMGGGVSVHDADQVACPVMHFKNVSFTKYCKTVIDGKLPCPRLRTHTVAASKSARPQPRR